SGHGSTVTDSDVVAKAEVLQRGCSGPTVLSVDERQLRVLREVGELGSVTAAAEALLVTPSAVSQQLRLLQRSMPVPLTERSGRRVVLTAAGRALAGAA